MFPSLGTMNSTQEALVLQVHKSLKLSITKTVDFYHPPNLSCPRSKGSKRTLYFENFQRLEARYAHCRLHDVEAQINCKP